MMLLQLLAEVGTDGCSREMLLSTLWPNKIVSDDSLTNLVSQTRSKLNSLVPLLIKTIPKKGYLLSEQVQFTLSHETPQQPITLKSLQKSSNHRHDEAFSASANINVEKKPITKKGNTWLYAFIGAIATLCMAIVYIFYQAPISDKSSTLAIFPIETFSKKESVIHGAASFTEELTHQFANYPGIYIVSRKEAAFVAKSGMSLQQMSEDMGAKYLIEGSVRESKGSVKITVQLVDGDTGMHVFSRVLEASLDKFENEKELIIQSISRLILSEIPISLSHIKDPFKPELLAKKCDSYLDVAKLYADFILDDISSIATAAETACIAYAQIKFGDAEAESKIAELYLYMAIATKSDRNEMRSFVHLGHKYLNDAAKSDSQNIVIFVNRAKLNFIEIEDSLNNGLNNKSLFEKALKNLSQGLELYPQNIDLLNSQGEIYRNLGVSLRRKGESPLNEFELAEKSFRQVIDLLPKDETAWSKLARLQMSMAAYLNDVGKSPISKLTHSVQSYQKAIDSSPNKPSNHISIASSLIVLGGLKAEEDEPYQKYFDRAKENLKEAFNISPKLFRAQSNLADLYRRLAKIKYENGEDVSSILKEGILHGRKSLEINDSYVWSYFTLMELFRTQSLLDYAQNKNAGSSLLQCLDYGNKGIEIKSDSARAWISLLSCEEMRARIYLENSQSSAAKQSLTLMQEKIENLIQLDPKYSYSYQIKGNQELLLALVTKQTDFSLAIQSFEKAVELNASNKERKLSLLEAYLYQYSATPISKLQQKIQTLIGEVAKNKKVSAEFQLQQAIFLQLQNKKVNMKQQLNNLKQQFKLTAQSAIRQYQRFLIH